MCGGDYCYILPMRTLNTRYGNHPHIPNALCHDIFHKEVIFPDISEMQPYLHLHTAATIEKVLQVYQRGSRWEDLKLLLGPDVLLRCIRYGTVKQVRVILEFRTSMNYPTLPKFEPENFEDHEEFHLLFEAICIKAGESADRSSLQRRLYWSLFDTSMSLVILVLCGFYFNPPNLRQNYEAAARELFRHIPDSHVLVTEIETLFKNLFDIRPSFVTQDQEANSDMSIDMPPNSEPRPLMHLSRCVIRQAVATNVSVRNGIEWLPVPNMIKN